jgi:hypothetical protein
MAEEDKPACPEQSRRARTLPAASLPSDPANSCNKSYSQHPESRIQAISLKANGLIFSTRNTFAIFASRTVLRGVLCAFPASRVQQPASNPQPPESERYKIRGEGEQMACPPALWRANRDTNGFRNRRNPLKIKHITFSNRDSNRVSPFRLPPGPGSMRCLEPDDDSGRGACVVLRGGEEARHQVVALNDAPGKMTADLPVQAASDGGAEIRHRISAGEACAANQDVSEGRNAAGV